MKIMTIVGARPQFIKAAVVSRALIDQGRATEMLIHTGQHYDRNMSDVFFRQLGIPEPHSNLKIGSGLHGAQTGKMLEAIEQALIQYSPDRLVVYGDTNSTLAGALAAAKLHIPIAHVEAGLRSFNRRMPEEINRVMADHLSDMLFCPTKVAVENLEREGIQRGVHLVGDVMYDCAMVFAKLAEATCDPLKDLKLKARGFILMTCHRAENTDDPERLREIVRAANVASEMLPVVFPVHPRLNAAMSKGGLQFEPSVRVVEPVPYFEMLLLERAAAAIVTDSGGVQKEAFFYGVPCVTMRDETEWTETVACGANHLTGANSERILDVIRRELDRPAHLPDAGDFYGHGKASARIAELLCQQ